MKNEKWQKRIIPLLLAVLAVLSVLCWPAVFWVSAKNEKEYGELLSRAQELYEKQIYTDAIACLRRAEAKNPDRYDSLLLLARCLLAVEDEEGLDACSRAARLRPREETPYVLKAEWYVRNQRYPDAFSVLEYAKKEGCSSAILSGMEKDLDNLFLKQYIPADSVEEWFPCGEDSLARFSCAGKSGLLRADGSVAVPAQYSALGMLDAATGTVPGRHEGVLCFLLPDGSRKMVPDTAVNALGPFGNGLAPFEINGKYGYLDRDMQPHLFGLAYAGAFSEGTAAAEKDGKWALLDPNLNSLTPFCFDEILCDAYGFCVRYGRSILRKDGHAYLADSLGQFLSAGVEELRFPASPTEDIAFREGGLWGFMNREGEITVSPRYEDAGSFSQGLAPVKEAGTWHYIRPDGSAAGEGRYTRAGEFSSAGRAVVEDNGALYLIVMSRWMK